jgi:splicing factor 3B subunit 3
MACDAQVHGAGLRHIKADRRVNEWRAPGRRTIMKAATNERQVIDWIPDVNL